MQPYELSARQAALAIREGEISAEELVASCLERIDAVDADILAWAYLDRQHALQQARDADATRRAGQPLGPLHGVPVGVKDIFDTYDLPTEDGTPLHAGRTPAHDAAAVAAIRNAGAILMGKTVTAELAALSPGKTHNPHDPRRTPGGSSSGSAAAVAARMVPLAIGTQTNGSVIRPASYCGVVGYKPSFGLISRFRTLQGSRRLDQVGVFATNIEDAALFAEQLIGYDERDPDSLLRARPMLHRTAMAAPPIPPKLAFVETPAWSDATADTHAAFAELLDFLSTAIVPVDLSDVLADAVASHRTIMETDLAYNLRREYDQGSAGLSPLLRQLIERGRKHLAVDYRGALERIPPMRAALTDTLLEFDAIVTPAATGEAPVGLESTGDPVFCTPWTLCGLPAISVPALQGASGMPLGMQLVGAPGDDGRLLRTAHWLAQTLAEA